jgi:hypothetical protein
VGAADRRRPWAAPDPLREATGDRLASVELKLREVAGVRLRTRRTKAS